MHGAFSRAIALAHRSDDLDQLARTIWQGVASGGLDEVRAVELAALIDARRRKLATPRIRAGQGPRRTKPTSRLHCRRVARHRLLPDALAAHFTTGELAALNVILSAVKTHGHCDFPLARIAALAGVSESTARRGVRQAQSLGLLHVQERRLRYARNLPNVITLVSTEARQWLAGAAHRVSFVPTQDKDKNIIDQNGPIVGCHGGLKEPLKWPRRPLSTPCGNPTRRAS